MSESLIDRIYECAFAPEYWPALLADLGGVASARTGLLFLSDGRTIDKWVASNEQSDVILRPIVESGWLFASQRCQRCLASNHAGFLREHDIYQEEELPHDPFYRDLLYPRGAGWSAGTAIGLPTGDRVLFVLEKEFRLGPVTDQAVESLDALRPHLARSAMMAVRLSLERARVATETLAALNLPALIFSTSGTVLAANSLIDDLSDFVIWRARDRVALRDRPAEALLAATLAGAAPDSVRSFPVRDQSGEDRMVAHVVPIRLSARDIFLRGMAALILTPVAAPAAPPVELVRLLFDLTPAEARVARSIAAGSSAEDIATASQLSLNTVRTHLRRVLDKTGCHRQAELVAVLGGLNLPQR